MAVDRPNLGGVRRTGWRVVLVGGPFDAHVRPLFAPRELEEAPHELRVYLCPCCDQVVPLIEDDPRERDLHVYGVSASLYRLVHGTDAVVIYEYAP